ncbi:hypothetical protein AB4865_08745 [Capnocytophaga sp. ARDL2]|uniref:hypothetical protein n=1 Tax=Capnocytophaga sp. ARDL2 TaxID=3238809 RepID=UPI003559299F
MNQEMYFISHFPEIHPITDFQQLRRTLILKKFSLFFYVYSENNTIRIVRFWDNRQNPKDL